jgi:hypothetical protein
VRGPQKYRNLGLAQKFPNILDIARGTGKAYEGRLNAGPQISQMAQMALWLEKFPLILIVL